MNKYYRLFLFVFLLICCRPLSLMATIDTTKHYIVYKFDIKEVIAPPILHTAQSAFRAADSARADIILIHMNTYGGMVDIADSLRTKVLTSQIPVYVFIDNNAASAGALISIASDKIFMRRGANIGAATVVDQTGDVVPDKYQSYMRSMMRSTAEATGRDPDIAQAMVDPSIYIPGVIDSGKVLTFTTSEAILHGFSDGEAENISEVLELAGIKSYEIIEHQLTSTDRIIRFLISPMISGLLIMIIVGGIYFELQTPGIGFPIAASIIAALLYFAPLYIEGIAQNWEILLFVIGVLLVGIELFAIPGFGVTGIAGVIAIVVSLALSMVDNQGFSYEGVPAGEIAQAFFIVIIASFSSLILSFYTGRKLFTTTRFGELALDVIQNKDDGYTSADVQLRDLIGKEGVAATILRPGGTVEIDDEHYDAIAQTSYIDKGTKVVVVKYENMQIIVRKK